MNTNEVFQATRSFVAPFELMGSRPRDVRLSAGGKFVMGCALAMFAGAIVAVVLLSRLSISQSETRDLFRQTNEATTAEVTRLWRDSDEDKQPRVAYRFNANGAAIEGQSKIRIGRWRGLHVGDSIDIRYLPSKPAVSRLAGSEPDVLPLFVPILLGALLAIAGSLILRAISCERRLLMDGRAAPAIVTGIVKHHSSHGGTHRSLKYTFPMLNGAIATGKSEASKKLPAVGSVICIVYDPDRPRRSRRYPFSLVKTARL